MSAVCSEDPGTVWGQCSLIGMAPGVRKGTAANVPGGIPVKGASSVYPMEVSGRRGGSAAEEGDGWNYPNWDIRERLPLDGHENLHKYLKGRAWICAVSTLTVIRTGLCLPITYCSKQCYCWVITRSSIAN